MCNICNQSSCNGCMTSILNNQSSVIPNPLCTPPCGPVIGCPDIVFSQCVIYSGANLNCTGINTNDNLTVALGKINAQICGISPPSGYCTVQVDGNDTCCGYLYPKIQTSTLNKSINNVGGCESIQLDEKPWTFQNVGYLNGFTTPSAFPTPLNTISPNTPSTTPVAYGVRTGYPVVPNLLEVRWKGEMLTQFFTPANGLVNVLAFQIPVSIAPTTPKYYTGTAIDSSGIYTVVYSILINTDGKVYINTGPSFVDRNIQIIIPFDGLNYVK